MVAATVAAPTEIAGTPGTMGSVAWAGVTDAAVRTTTGGRWRVGWGAGGATVGVVYGGRITLPSTQNLSTRLVTFYLSLTGNTGRISSFGSNLTTAAGVMFVLASASGARRWKIVGGDGSAPVRVCVDPNQSSTAQSTTGTFDPAAVTAIEIHLQASATGAAEVQIGTSGLSAGGFYSIPDTGVLVSGGDVGNGPASLATVVDNAIYSALTSRAANNAYSTPFPIKFAPDLGAISSGYLNFEKLVTDGSDGYGAIHVPASKMGINFDIETGDSCTVSDSLLISVNGATFDTVAAGTLTFSSASIQRFSTLNFRDCTLESSLINGYDSILLDDAISSGTTISGANSSTDEITIANIPAGGLAATIANTQGIITITEAAGDYSDSLLLALPAGQVIEMSGGGGDYDFSGLSGGSSGDRVVFDAVDGSSYNITVSGNIFAEAADPETSGSITLIAPSVDFSAPNLADGAIYQILHRQTFTVAAAAINTTTNAITLTTDSNGDAPDFDTTTSGRHTLCRVILASGATIPASIPQILDTGAYRVASLSSGAITLEVTEGGGAIDFTSQGTNNGGGVLIALVFETLVVEGTVSGGAGVAETITLPDGAIYRFKAIHQDTTGGPRLSTRLLDTTGAWSASAGATVVDVVNVNNSASDLWTEANRIALLSSLELEDTVIDNAGNIITSTNPVEDGADIGGLTFLLEGHGFIQINAGSVTKNASSVNGALSGQDLVMWAVYQLGILDNLYLASSTTVVLDGLSNAVIDNVEFDETSGNLFQIYGMNIRERDGRPIVSASTTGPVIPNVATRGNVGLTSVGSGLSTDQSTQLTTLYNATTAGTGATVFSVASLANAPIPLDATETQTAVEDALFSYTVPTLAQIQAAGFTTDRNNALIRMAKQLGLVAGVTATHTETGITVSDGDGSTAITDNGGGSYTVESA